MTHISDEILNKYIDNELEAQELSELNEHLKVCSSCLAKLKALKTVDLQLKRIETFQPKADFTQNLMKKIERMPLRYAQKKKNYFFRFVVAFFLLLTAGIITAAILMIPASAPSANAELEWYKTAIEMISGKIAVILSDYRSLFSNRNFPIVSSGFAFIVLVSIYVVYESFRGVKGRLH